MSKMRKWRLFIAGGKEGGRVGLSFGLFGLFGIHIDSIAVSFPQVVYFNLSFAFYLFVCLVFSVIYVVATPPLVTEGMGRRGAAMTMMTSSQSGQSSQIEYTKKKNLISNMNE